MGSSRAPERDAKIRVSPTGRFAKLIHRSTRLLVSLRSLVAALLLFGSGVVLLAAPPPGARFDFYERFVAIDGACAWPNLSLLPDGRIVAIIWPYTNHAITEGSAESWVSEDHGASWKKSGVPMPHAPGTNRMNVAAGAVDGQVVTLMGGWDQRVSYQLGQSLGPATHRGVTIQPRTAVSGDAGAHWQQLPETKFPLRADGKSLIPYGRVAKIRGGGIGVCLYGESVFFYHSADGGVTWTKRGTIVEGKTHNETTWVELDNGDLFAAARTYGDIRLEAYRSTDGGRTWKAEGPLTLAQQHPADLLKLPDGRVLLSYASRNPDLYAIWVQIGDPELRAWSSPMLLVDLEGSSEFQRTPVPSSDGGYPSTVLTADGTFVTAYYSRGVSAHQRYHVGVVRWRLPKNALPVLVRPTP